MKDNRTFRLVSDYGYGDKTWLERGLTPDEAVSALNRVLGATVVTTIDQAQDYDHPIYSIELDDENDKEDWDWMDS